MDRNYPQERRLIVRQDSAESVVRGGSEGGVVVRQVPAAQEVLEARIRAQGLFQVCVVRLGFLQHGNIGVGVFPEREEFLIGGAGFGQGVRL